MNRLTQKDEQGNWCLKGVKWEQLRVGSVITEDTAERLYSALWNLVEYEDTQELAEEIVDRYTDIFVKSAEERQKRRCMIARADMIAKADLLETMRKLEENEE